MILRILSRCIRKTVRFLCQFKGKKGRTATTCFAEPCRLDLRADTRAISAIAKIPFSNISINTITISPINHYFPDKRRTISPTHNTTDVATVICNQLSRERGTTLNIVPPKDTIKICPTTISAHTARNV